jgi:hypothetical protein
MRRDLEHERDRLEYIEREVERSARGVDQARLEARAARRGLVTDAVFVSVMGYVIALLWPMATLEVGPMLLVVFLLGVGVVTTLGNRVTSIARTRRVLATQRRNHRQLEDERVAHVRSMEELAGGVSLAVSTDEGKLTQVD